MSSLLEKNRHGLRVFDIYDEAPQKFVESLRSRKRPPCDVVDGHLSTTALHLANISYRTGRTIYWDAEKEQIVNDPEANAYPSKE